MTRTSKRFPAAVLAAIRDGQVLGIRAGSAPHRVIGVWAVVVDERVFVRSWGVKARGWYRTFVAEPTGAIVPMGRTREIAVRAVRARGERLNDAVSRAYREKYHTPGSLKYVRDLSGPKSRNTTTELVPR
jgi:hypothetical protein